MARFMRSTCPFVQGCRGLVSRCVTSFWAQASSKAWARKGSVSTCASKYSLCSRTGGNVLSRGFQDGQHGHGAAEELESAAIGGNMLVVVGARTEKVAQFVVSPAEPGR